MKNTIIVNRDTDIEDIRRIQKDQRADRRKGNKNKNRDNILDLREAKFA